MSEKSDDFRLPADHPFAVGVRRRHDEAEARFKDVNARLTKHAGDRAQLVSGVGLALFVRDTPYGGYKPGGVDDEVYPEPSADDVLTVLGYVPDVRENLDRDERRLIEGARRRGATWQQIAEALGLNSRQAARQRYARRGGKPAELDKQIEAQEGSNGN